MTKRQITLWLRLVRKCVDCGVRTWGNFFSKISSYCIIKRSPDDTGTDLANIRSLYNMRQAERSVDVGGWHRKQRRRLRTLRSCEAESYSSNFDQNKLVTSEPWYIGCTPQWFSLISLADLSESGSSHRHVCLTSGWVTWRWGSTSDVET